MSSWRYVSEGDPDAEAHYSIRADSRLRLAFLGQQVAQIGEGYVRLDTDDIGPQYDLLSAVTDLEKLLAKLKDEAGVQVLASGGTYKEIGEVLDVSEHEAKRRYAEAWAERQAQHSATEPRAPIDPALRHLMRDLRLMDAWCVRRDPLSGEAQVTAGLVFPGEAGDEVRTASEVRDAELEAERQAENDAMVAAYLEEREAARVKALTRLARKTGLAKASLWGKAGGIETEYVIARDGRYLGILRRARYDSARLTGVRWHVRDADPAVTWEQRDHPYLTMEEAMDFLDRNSPAPAVPADEN